MNESEILLRRFPGIRREVSGNFPVLAGSKSLRICIAGIYKTGPDLVRFTYFGYTFESTFQVSSYHEETVREKNPGFTTSRLPRGTHPSGRASVLVLPTKGRQGSH